MKKLSTIFMIVIFAASLFLYSCSASGGVSVGKQQNGNVVKVTK